MPRKQLPPMRRRFVHEYLKDLNATQAAIRAGYSKTTADTQGPRLLENVGVRNAIDTGIALRAVRVEAKSDDVLRELVRLATVDVGGAFDGKGRLLPLSKMPEDVRRAISGVEVEELWGDDGEGGRTQVGVLRKVKFWDKGKALDQLGRHLGLFKDRVEFTGADGGPVQLQAEVKVEHADEPQRLAKILDILHRAGALPGGVSSGSPDATSDEVAVDPTSTD